MRVLVLGASGMLGNAMIRVLSEEKKWVVYGTVRSESSMRLFSNSIAERLLSGCDVEQTDALVKAFIWSKPDVVINCIGLIKQYAHSENPLQAIPINSLLPHRIASLCEISGARMVHISTDCVFSGKKGDYMESDVSDAYDLYGKSKLLGEVAYPNAITLRTSIIGHELQSANGLVNWFLSQEDTCKGYRKAIFSGLPTVVIAQIIRDVVIPRKDIYGLYHVAAKSISKYDLLTMIANIYRKTIKIVPDDKLVINRSLNAKRFEIATGYIAPEWSELIKIMHDYK